MAPGLRNQRRLNTCSGALGGGEPDLRRTQPVHGAFDSVGDPPGDEGLVLVDLLGELEMFPAQRAGSRMIVDGRDQHVRRRDARLLLDELTSLVAHVVLEAQQVDDHQRKPRLPIVEHKAPRVQLVVDVRGRKRQKTANDRRTQGRRDVTRGRTGAKRRRGRSRSQECGAHEAGNDAKKILAHDGVSQNSAAKVGLDTGSTLNVHLCQAQFQCCASSVNPAFAESARNNSTGRPVAQHAILHTRPFRTFLPPVFPAAGRHVATTIARRTRGPRSSCKWSAATDAGKAVERTPAECARQSDRPISIFPVVPRRSNAGRRPPSLGRPPHRVFCNNTARTRFRGQLQLQ